MNNVPNRNVVPVGLCKKLLLAIGLTAGTCENWYKGSGDHRWRLSDYKGHVEEWVPAYTLGDLLAYCRSRKWGANVWWHIDLLPQAKVTSTDYLRVYYAQAATLPAALALAVLAACKATKGGVK